MIKNNGDLLAIGAIFFFMTALLMFQEKEDIESIIYRTFLESSIDFEGSIDLNNFEIEFNGGKEKDKMRMTFFKRDILEKTSFVLLDYYETKGKSYYSTAMQSWRNTEPIKDNEFIKNIEGISFEKSKLLENIDIKEEGVEYISLKHNAVKEMEIRTRAYLIHKNDFIIKLFIDDNNQIRKLEANCCFQGEKIEAEIFFAATEKTRACLQPENIDAIESD